MPTTISGTTGVSQVQDGVITNADINNAAAIDGTKINSNFGNQNIAAFRGLFTRGMLPTDPAFTAFTGSTATVAVSGGVHVSRGQPLTNDPGVGSSNTGFAFIGNRDTGMFDLFPQHGLDNTLSFLTDNIERVRINETGQVLIGGAAATSPGFDATLYVESGIGAMVGMGSNVAGSSTTIAVGRRRTNLVAVANSDSLGKFSAFGWNGTAYNEAARIETFVDATPGVNDMPGRLVFSTTADGASTPTERMRITTGGVVRISGLAGALVNVQVDTSGNLVRGTSDERLKEGITTIDNALSKVQQIDGKYFYWKNKENNGSEKRVGFIAQNVKQAVPELVYENPDGMYGVHYGETTALLINAVKELKQQLDSALQRISELESK